jgi:glycosyltransferase involved in cell wall biosynthesis
MKILHCVESYFPSTGGMQEVVKQLSERLVKMGHEVTVATRKIPGRDFKEKNGVVIKEFDVSGNLVIGINGESEAYRKFLLESNFDVVSFFAAQQWATDLALDILPQIKGKKVSVPTGYSNFYHKDFKDYYSKMRSWIKNYDMNVYLSDNYRDIDFARENGVTKMEIIPNGAAEDEFLAEKKIDIRKKFNIPPQHPIILHVGSYTGRKGHRETVEIFLKSRIGPATLLMIGNDYEKFYRQYIKHPSLGFSFLKNKLFGNKKIIFGSFPRELTVEAYRQSDVFLFPSNIECSPIVLFECAAARLPFISTDVGNSREIAEWTAGGIITKTEKDQDGFSHAVIDDAVKNLESLLAEPQRRRQMSEQAFLNWKEKFSWEKIAQRYERMYLSLLK